MEVVRLAYSYSRIPTIHAILVHYDRAMTNGPRSVLYSLFSVLLYLCSLFSNLRGVGEHPCHVRDRHLMSQVRPPGPAVTEAVDEDDGTGHCRVAVCGVCVAGSAEGGAEGVVRGGEREKSHACERRANVCARCRGGMERKVVREGVCMCMCVGGREGRGKPKTSLSRA